MDIQSILSSAENFEFSFNVGLFIVMIALVLLSSFFSMSETAFSSCSDVKLKVAIEERRSGAKKAFTLFENFDRTLTTLLIGNNLVNVALSTIAVMFFSTLIMDGNIANLVSTAVITLVLLIFGEIFPKMIAKLKPETIAIRVAWIIYVFTIIFYPLSIFFIAIQKLITKNNSEEDEIDEDELSKILEKMLDEETISEYEANMIKSVLDLNDRSVEDIMVPRIMMEALDYESTLDEVKSFMESTPYSRIPVYKKDKDHIVGVLHVRDFYPALIKNPKCSWKRLIKPIKFVSAAMKVDSLIQELQTSKMHIAIVSGEWGDVLGMVTMEDALEELIGEIYDEHDVPGDNDLRFDVQEDGSYIIDAEIYVDDLFEKLHIGDVPEDVPNKLSGWLFAKCESLPQVGFTLNYLARYTMQNEETEEYEDYNKILEISVYEVVDRRITLAKVVVRDATEEEIDEYEDEEDD